MPADRHVEASDRVEDNMNPIGRLYYSASTTMCCAHAGLGTVRRAIETPFNLILEARH